MSSWNKSRNPKFVRKKGEFQWVTAEWVPAEMIGQSHLFQPFVSSRGVHGCRAKNQTTKPQPLTQQRFYPCFETSKRITAMVSKEVHAKSPKSSCRTLWENRLGLFGVGCPATPRHWYILYLIGFWAFLCWFPHLLCEDSPSMARGTTPNRIRDLTCGLGMINLVDNLFWNLFCTLFLGEVSE